MLVVSDSMMPTVGPYDDTLLPCSPTQLPNTDVACATMKDLDQHEKKVEEQVGVCSIWAL